MALRKERFNLGGIKVKTLVKKDISLNIFINIAVILGGLLLGFVITLFNEIGFSQIISLWFGVILIFYPLGALTTEDKKTKDIILRSLPIDRRHIVLSRYITMLIYSISIPVIVFLSPYIIGFMYGISFLFKPTSIWVLLFHIILTMIIVSIILPTQYLSGGISKVLSIGLYFILIIVPLIISQIDNGFINTKIYNYVGNIKYGMNSIILIFLGIVIYFLSSQVSIKLYKSIDR